MQFKFLSNGTLLYKGAWVATLSVLIVVFVMFVVCAGMLEGLIMTAGHTLNPGLEEVTHS